MLDSASGQALEVAVGLAYPLTDLILLGVIVGALAGTGWQLDRTWVLLFVGVAAFWLADSLYLVGNANGTYTPGAWFEIGWWLGLLLIGAAAWQPARPALAAGADERLRRIVLPLMFGSAGLGLLVYGCIARAQRGRGRARRRVAAGRDGAHDADLPRQRRDAARLARGGADRRADRARQPARAGARARARAAARDDRRAARAGAVRPRRLQALQRHVRPPGGRFPAGAARRQPRRRSCAGAAPPSAWAGTSSARCSPRATRSPSRSIVGAAAALSERGEGFEIGCSYGAIELPLEAADVADALRIADQRMYAQKNAGRMSASRQSKDVLLRALAERNPQLRSHLGDVADLAEATALHLQLSHDEVEQVRHAAELHDVGKVAVPDAILTKPGPLDEDEWAFIRRHTIIGERIIGAAPALTARRRARPPQPRALGRRRLPRRAGRGEHPARRAHRRGRRRVRRDDQPAPVLAPAHAGGRAGGARALRRHAVRPRRGRRLQRRLARPLARRRRLKFSRPAPSVAEYAVQGRLNDVRRRPLGSVVACRGRRHRATSGCGRGADRGAVAGDGPGDRDGA